MKINVKLFGTLDRDFPGYDLLKGMEVNITDGSCVKDLLEQLDIPETKGCFVSMNNCVVKGEAILRKNATITILQALAGG